MSARSFDINSTRKQSNIQVIQEGETKCVKLHNTVVFGLNRSGMTLNSGGWRTSTTKIAINRAISQTISGYGVFQKKGQWFVSCPDNVVLPFVDGMSINF